MMEASRHREWHHRRHDSLREQHRMDSKAESKETAKPKGEHSGIQDDEVEEAHRVAEESLQKASRSPISYERMR
jgi:hypothetical protein